MTADDPARLTAIREREQAATEGPWKAETSFSPAPYHTPSWSVVDADHHPSVQLTRYVADICHGLEDAEFIAHAREDIPYLLAEIARLQTERDEAHQHAAEIWDALADDVARNGERDVPDGATVAEGVRSLLRSLREAEAARDEAQRERDALKNLLRDGGTGVPSATDPATASTHEKG